MILGCIDIGSNTTRLLVVDAVDGDARQLKAERAFTCIRKSVDGSGRIPPEKIAETVAVVEAQARSARALGADPVVAVATAVIRDAPNRDELERAIGQALGTPLRVISGEEEARLSFAGATGTLPQLGSGTVAVVDVGGGSTEIAVGRPPKGVEWWRSLGVGSGVLADRHLRSAPPTSAELASVRSEVAAAFERIDAPEVETAVAVGGTATSLLGVLGAALDHDMLERALATLTADPWEVLADRLALDIERVRVLPAGVLILQAASDVLGPLHVASGGLREGVLHELIAQR